MTRPRPSNRARCCTPPAPGSAGADLDLPRMAFSRTASRMSQGLPVGLFLAGLAPRRPRRVPGVAYDQEVRMIWPMSCPGCSRTP
jgi:hypothetical protein